MKLKILSYNVHKLFDITGRKYFLSQLKDILIQMDLDFVFLQEIPGLQPEDHKKNYTNEPLEHLADRIWDHFVYGKNAISSTRNHGNAILSKYRFMEWKNFNISNHRFEQRGFLIGKIKKQRKTVFLCCTHLDLTSIGRKRQIKKIEEHIKEEITKDAPMIFCGDFNDWTGSISKFMKDGGYQCTSVHPKKNTTNTFPSFYPLLSLDRIFYRNIECTEVRVLEDEHWKKLSDHLPIYAEFTVA